MFVNSARRKNIAKNKTTITVAEMKPQLEQRQSPNPATTHNMQTKTSQDNAPVPMMASEGIIPRNGCDLISGTRSAIPYVAHRSAPNTKRRLSAVMSAGRFRSIIEIPPEFCEPREWREISCRATPLSISGNWHQSKNAPSPTLSPSACPGTRDFQAITVKIRFPSHQVSQYSATAKSASASRHNQQSTGNPRQIDPTLQVAHVDRTGFIGIVASDRQFANSSNRHRFPLTKDWSTLKIA